MTYGDAMFIRDDPKILLRRFSAFVGPYPAKVLAKKGGCSEDTAEKWREGVSWPNARHWIHLLAAFGRDLTECVFHPEEAAARLEREAQELERKLAEVEAQLQLVGGEARSVSGSRPKAARRQAVARSKAPAGHDDRAAAVTAGTGRKSTSAAA